MRPLALMAATALLAAHSVQAAPQDPQKLPAARVLDLHYGDVLFYVYTDDDFEAITRLNAYEQWHLLPHHEAEAQLLLGGLYLSLGLHNEAGARFEKLLTPDIPAGVRNRAWFYLAQVWYARGYLENAEHAILQVQGPLPSALDAEREHLHANILLREGRFDAAIQLLNNWKGPSDWMAYARFNLGVALIRAGRLAEADPVLTAVGTLNSDKEELLALKDRANLALGFAYLQAEKPQQAVPVLGRVRLRGPYSDKALLGTGWADAALGARFLVTDGVVHIAQPSAARAAAAAAIPRDAWRLGSVHAATTLTGSPLIALALAKERLSADEAWAAAHVDEDWNIAQWGEDEEAMARRAFRFAEFQAAAKVLRLL